jgi:hypothetical protein
MIPYPVFAAEDRTGELSGIVETVKPEQAAPGIKEPEATLPSKNEASRPALKMPEVVVKGERQFRVTAERRELLMLDPMSGTKEIPSDLAAVAIPGLDTHKGAPVLQTLTAKNYLMSFEAGVGTSRLTESRLALGQEFTGFNYLFRSEYAAGQEPEAFGFTPYGQGVDAGLDLRANLTQDLNIMFTLTGRGETQSQPNQALAWGEWLERGHVGAALQAEQVFGALADLKCSGKFQSFVQRGTPAEQPALNAQVYGGKAEYEQKIGHVLNDGLSFWAQFDVQGQKTRTSNFAPQDQEVSEQLKTTSLLGRFRFATLLLLDLGVELGDYQGEVTRNTANIIGSLSLVFPTGSFLYTQSHPGLRWKPMSDWAYEQPHPGRAFLPKPEVMQSNYRAGWRQSWLGMVSSDLAWFRQKSGDTLVWLDMNQDGLFEFQNLENTYVDGAEAGVEIHYSPSVSQSVIYTYRYATAGSDFFWPYVPKHQIQTELRVTRLPWEVSVQYKYAGERYAATDENASQLNPAHLLGAKIDYELRPGWTVFMRLENLLNANWEEWAGYPARSLSALAGLRVGF